MFKLCVFITLMASALSAPVQEKTNNKRGLSLGYGYGGLLGLDSYHGLEAYHAPFISHAPFVSHAPLISHTPLISHASLGHTLPYHAPLAYSSPYVGFGHYPYFH